MDCQHFRGFGSGPTEDILAYYHKGESIDYFTQRRINAISLLLESNHDFSYLNGKHPLNDFSVQNVKSNFPKINMDEKYVGEPLYFLTRSGLEKCQVFVG